MLHNMFSVFPSQAHLKRAQALKSALESSMYRLPKHLNFSTVVEDLCACHRLEQNESALAEAIVVAVDHGKCELSCGHVD